MGKVIATCKYMSPGRLILPSILLAAQISTDEIPKRPLTVLSSAIYCDTRKSPFAFIEKNMPTVLAVYGSPLSSHPGPSAPTETQPVLLSL
jgi:hypothetical protein